MKKESGCVCFPSFVLGRTGGGFGVPKGSALGTRPRDTSLGNPNEALRCRRADRCGGAAPAPPPKGLCPLEPRGTADISSGRCLYERRKYLRRGGKERNSGAVRRAEHRESSRCLAADLMFWERKIIKFGESQGLRGMQGGKRLASLRNLPKASLRGWSAIVGQALSLCHPQRLRWFPPPCTEASEMVLPPSPTGEDQRHPSAPGAPRPTLIIATSKIPLHIWCQRHGADGAVLIPLACTQAEASSPEGWGYRGKGTACSRFPSPIAG